MLDIPALGIPLINGAIRHVAEHSESGTELDQSLAILETARALTDRTELKAGLRALSKNQAEYLQREKDVMRSLIEEVFVKDMM